MRLLRGNNKSVHKRNQEFLARLNQNESKKTFKVILVFRVWRHKARLTPRGCRERKLGFIAVYSSEMRDYFLFPVVLSLTLTSCARRPASPPVAVAPPTATPTPSPSPTKGPLILSPFDGAPPPPTVVSLNRNLLAAAAFDDIAGIKKALARGADINVLEDQSKAHTPLTYAAESGWTDATRFLLQHGANPNGNTLRDGPQFSPLFWTVDRGQVECTRLLLRAGADPNRLGPGPSNIIEMAAGDGNIAIVNMLIGRMPKLESYDRRKLRTQANNVRFCRVCSNGSLPQARAALAVGADVNYVGINDAEGDGSPLMRATDRGDLPLMKLLLQRGAKANLRKDDGSTALMYVGRGSYYFGRGTSRLSALKAPLRAASTRLLLDAGADIKLRDSNGLTALMYAAQGNAAATALLLARGADVEARDNQKRTALHWAASVRDDRSLRVLLRDGAQINARDIEGATALMLASVHPDAPASTRENVARIRSMKLLRRAGSNARIKDNRGKTATNYRKMHDGDFVNGG